MSGSDVTKQGLQGVRPGREAAPSGTAQPPARSAPGRRRGKRGEQPMVPDAAFTSYYGKPSLNQPTWEARDIAGYLFLGGLAGASSLIAAGAHLTARPGLARALKCAAAAASDLTGRAPRAGPVATATAATAGPVVATYTAALIADTAVPAWHDGHRYLPFLFAASAITAAAGLGLAAAPRPETEPVRRLGVAAGAAELIIETLMKKRMGLSAEAYEEGRAKKLGQAGHVLAVSGVLTAGLAGHRSRPAAVAAGAALLAASALTRFAIFHAGLNSAADPRYTVIPQRQRLDARVSQSG
jgi:formate-dependent nitrite reductase membrane component NrfD